MWGKIEHRKGFQSCKKGNKGNEEMNCKTCKHTKTRIDVNPCKACIKSGYNSMWSPKINENEPIGNQNHNYVPKEQK